MPSPKNRIQISPLDKAALNAGFTLIELSIVLVIIGLIVGGILVGADLISAARIRAQLSQIEQLNVATHTFQDKYNGLPGDISDPRATTFGFSPRGQYAGEGDGNGVIEGIYNDGPGRNSGWMQSGEMSTFWVDLSSSGLIGETFTLANPTSLVTATPTSNPSIDKYLPLSKLKNGNYVNIRSTGGLNFFAISAISNISNGNITASGTIPVIQAYIIDTKIDDGIPATGRVIATFGMNGPNPGSHPATPGNATSCYDNNNICCPVNQYSIEVNNGNGENCSLSIQFQ